MNRLLKDSLFYKSVVGTHGHQGPNMIIYFPVSNTNVNKVHISYLVRNKNHGWNTKERECIRGYYNPYSRFSECRPLFILFYIILNETTRLEDRYYIDIHYESLSNTNIFLMQQ